MFLLVLPRRRRQGETQSLLPDSNVGGSLHVAAKQFTNLTKVTNVQQEKNKSPFFKLLEALRAYTPMDSEAPANRQAVAVAFANQDAPDIGHKFQKTDGRVNKSLQDLLAVAEGL